MNDVVGIDLVHIPEFERQISLGGEALLERAFHPSERDSTEIEHLAGLWAAKEATIKALGMKAGDWLEIVITHSPNGRPFAAVNGRSVDISIAHHGDYAVAVAVA